MKILKLDNNIAIDTQINTPPDKYTIIVYYNIATVTPNLFGIDLNGNKGYPDSNEYYFNAIRYSRFI